MDIKSKSLSATEYREKLAQVQDAKLNSKKKHKALQDIGEAAGFGEDLDTFISLVVSKS